MIDSITVPLNAFDLNGLFDAYRAFYGRWTGEGSDPNTSLFLLTRYGDTPLPMSEEVDPVKTLIGQLGMVFVPIHEPAATDKVKVIDGTEADASQLDIGVMDLYGLLLEAHEGEISVHPALYDGSSGPYPTATIQGTCSLLDGVIAQFRRRFLRGGQRTVRGGPSNRPIDS
jgi:hypothetical protein